MKTHHPTTSAETEELPGLLGYQLHLTHLIALREARAVLEHRGLTPAKLTALLFIRDQPGRTQSDLARLLLINRSSAMKLVDTLVDHRFIRRGEGKDLRSHGLYLTVRGAGSLRSALAVLQEEDRMLSAALSADERLLLLGLLQKVRSAARAKDMNESMDERKAL